MFYVPSLPFCHWAGASTKNVMNYYKEKQMAIRLHSFISSGKRYIQVETQPHHVIGIFRKIMRSKNMRECEFVDIYNAYYECEKDGTITFYQAQIPGKTCNTGIWTYLAYECPEGQEKVFQDSACIDNSIKSLRELFAGGKLVQTAVDINEYLKYKYNDNEYIDIQLPFDWNTPDARKIGHLLLQELDAFKTSCIFTEGAGKKYMKAVLSGFSKAAQKVIETYGDSADFEAAQYEVLKKIKINEMANLIIECNDYRIWQAALPSKSKAVEYAFNAALNFIAKSK
jgi:hypothetical protein